MPPLARTDAVLDPTGMKRESPVAESGDSRAPNPLSVRRRPRAVRHLDPFRSGVGDEAVLMVVDIIPTSYEVDVLNGHVAPGDVVAIIGAGPIGLSAIIGARLSAARVTSSRLI